ncbi:MAG: transcription-repair coupling factor (superfamily II helicase) [Planctomycetota bacterium]|jgi:transcription-repair coupling factor (superfamily II helicase)
MSKQEYLSALIPELPDKIETRRYWGRLHGSSRALAIISAVDISKKLLVVVTADLNSARQLLQELHFYKPRSSTYPILSFPDWETLPYDLFSPYQDIISQRLATLVTLSTLESGILVVPVSTAMHRLLPGDYLLAHSLLLAKGQKLELNEFRSNLQNNGYRIVSQVSEHGDVAIRGSLLDIYPMGSDAPYRIDLFDEEIDSIRVFDPESQRSLNQVDSIRILPAREVPMSDEHVARFRKNWRSRFEGNPNNSPVYRDVSDAIAPAGIEYYLPLFYAETYSLFDHLQDECLVALDEDVSAAAERFWQDIEERFEQRRHDVERPLLPPGEAFYNPHEFFTRIKPFGQIHISIMARDKARAGSLNFASRLPVNLSIDARAKEPLGIVQRFLRDFDGRVLFVAESAGRRETILEIFNTHGLRVKQFSNWQEFLTDSASTGLTVAPLEQGAILEDPNIAIVSETQLFGERAQQKRLRKRKKQDTDAIVRNLTELTIGAPVVHEDHGVGRYLGLVTLVVEDIPAEYIYLEYDQGDKLYVPVASLDIISRYSGADPEHAPLHRLGSGQWQKARRKAAERVRDVAAELLELHARRASRPGHKFELDEEALRAFAQGFPFEETAGQIEAIDDVTNDMKASKSMDRLICGDAGFGKTEVAMRAAFIAVNNNKQVALLVPTTLLAQQHYQNFTDRFADWPVDIQVLSRFQSKKEQDKTIAGLRDGKVDIVIGTHKLLQGNIHYACLGMVIIDEEHRFGVRQKEVFKSLRAEIDVLTLTATPIPRTLNLALSELRDLSIIASPPSRRLAVKTFVQEWNDEMLKEALLREIKRGGQVYVLHNKVKDIDVMAQKIEALIPEARVQIAHGQMPEKQLEQVMLDFYHRRFNILVCTTIIETGIDVPSANTIIINRADKFGLAQLYQLRGRVGRSHHRAYAYLLVPPRKSMTQDAHKRLEAIESLEELGIGFTLATHDLEIRGAGEILGEGQSGQIHEIGFGLYMELLDRAVKAMREGKQPELDRPLDHGTEIDLHIAALIPEDFLPDVHTRLIMYKRIASVSDESELSELQEEMIDRFGLLPDPIKSLFKIAKLKLKAGPLGIRKIELGENGGRLYFNEQTNIDTGKLINLIQSQPQRYKLDGQNKLRIIQEIPDSAARFKVLSDLLESITMRDAA